MSETSTSRVVANGLFARAVSGTVWVCPGPADEMEPCSYWQSAPGWCPFHAHIDLVAQSARQT